MNIKIFFLIFILSTYNFQILSLNKKFIAWKQKLNNELNLCFEQPYIVKKNLKNETWINNCLNGNLTIPYYFIKKLVRNPKLLKKLIEEIAVIAQTKLVHLKKEILKNYNDGLKNYIQDDLNIIEYQIFLGADILRYPHRKIVANSLKNLKEIFSDVAYDNINHLIKNLKNLYFILKQPLELLNQIKAVDYLNKLKLKNIKDIREYQIIKLHKILLKDIDDKYGGVIRNTSCNVNLFYDNFPEFNEIESAFKHFFNWIQNCKQNEIISFAADIHLKLLFIHPFVDGNGRVARLLMNFVLTQNNYSPLIVSKFDSIYFNYYNIVGESHKYNDINLFKEFLLRNIKQFK